MHVVLVAIHAYNSPQAVPLANAFLTSYLNTDEGLAAKVSVSPCDLYADQRADQCAAAILALEPATVGFSLYLWNRELCTEVARILRETAPQLTIFCGGPEVSANPLALSDSVFDFLIHGEGEIPFLEAMAQLVAGQPVTTGAGISIRGEGNPNLTRPHSVALLDTIPSPFLTGVLDCSDYNGVLWQLARGCSFACDFCFDQQGRTGVRRFSLPRIEAELRLFVRQQVTQVFVLDSTFNQNAKQAKTILRLIRKVAPHIHFHFEVRSEFIDREMANLFGSINCSLQIGLQSADPKVHKNVHRQFDPAGFMEKVSLLNQSGAIFGFDLIYGLPGDTLTGFCQSLDFALQLYPNHLDIFPLAVLPGTPLAGNASSWGLDHQAAPPYLLLGSLSFPKKDMEKAAALAAACDIFYSRGKAVAWFNSLLLPLRLSPSGFLRAFMTWLQQQPGKSTCELDWTDEAIWEVQRNFVSHIYSKKNIKRLLPVALDLIDYHYHYAAALLAPQPELPTDRTLDLMDILTSVLVLAPSARMAQFNYEIFDILEAGEIELADFADCFIPTGSHAVIYPRGDEIHTESLPKEFYRLLQRLDGTTPAGVIASMLSISPEEAREYLDFALAEGFVLPLPSYSSEPV